MIEILIVASLLVLSIIVNAVVSRWSVKRFIGIELSFMQVNALVLTRNLATLLAGFSLGYTIKLWSSAGEVLPALAIAGVVLIALVSFFSYWWMMRKASGARISLGALTKSIVAEKVILVIGVIAVSLVASTILVFLGVF